MRGCRASVTLVTTALGVFARKRAHQACAEPKFADVQERIALLSNVHHPNVVAYFACSLSEGCLDVYMEPWGPSVSVLIRNGRHGPEYVCDFMLDVLQGLLALQEGGMTHGDVKPSNVLFAHDTYKLCDCDDPLAISPNYMSAKRGRVWPDRTHDPTSDVYSVGMSAMEVLTGTTPYAELQEGVQTFYKVCHGCLPRLWSCTSRYDQQAVEAINHVLADDEHGPGLHSKHILAILSLYFT